MSDGSDVEGLPPPTPTLGGKAPSLVCVYVSMCYVSLCISVLVFTVIFRVHSLATRFPSTGRQVFVVCFEV